MGKWVGEIVALNKITFVNYHLLISKISLPRHMRDEHQITTESTSPPHKKQKKTDSKNQTEVIEIDNNCLNELNESFEEMEIEENDVELKTLSEMVDKKIKDKENSEKEEEKRKIYDKKEAERKQREEEEQKRIYNKKRKQSLKDSRKANNKKNKIVNIFLITCCY